MSPKRRYYKLHSNKDKYSIEQTNFNSPAVANWTQVPAANETQLDSLQWNIDVVPPTDFQGMRKIKHLTISLCNAGSNTESLALIYNIVFVPQGYAAQTIAFPNNGYALNNYTANQFVMSSGVIDFSAGPTRIYSRLSRNLNSGDRIILILAAPGGAASSIIGQISYAITLQ